MAHFHLYQKEKELPVNSGLTRQGIEDVNILNANLGDRTLCPVFFYYKKKKKYSPYIITHFSPHCNSCDVLILLLFYK